MSTAGTLAVATPFDHSLHTATLETPIMYSTPAQLADLQKSQIDSLNAIASTLVNATEQLTNLQFAAARALMQDADQTTKNLLASQGPQQALTIVSGLVQPSAEKFVSYSRNLYGIACGANAELSKLVDTQVAEGNGKIAELIELAFQDAPGGAAAAASFLKSAISTSHSAYEAVSKAAQHAVESGESNMAAAAAVADDVVKSKTRKAM